MGLFDLFKNKKADKLFDEGISYWKQQQDKEALIKFKEAADSGHAEAMRYVGYCYRSGRGGVDIDYRKAVEWYEKSADSGKPVNRYNAAFIYIDGLLPDNNNENAIRLLEKALSLGYKDAEHYLKKLKTDMAKKADEEAEEATRWRITEEELKIIRQIDPNQCYDKNTKPLRTEVRYVMGRIYYEGDIVEKDMAKAFKWYSAARDSHEKSRFMLGEMHANGYGTPKDRQKALDWYKKAAQKGSKAGRYKRGDILHRNGKDKEALEYLLIAAEKGSSIAWLECGIIYRQGNLWKQDMEKAEYWLKKASGSDNPGVALEAISYIDQYF